MSSKKTWKLDGQKRKEIVRLFRAGNPAARIAKIYGVSQGYVGNLSRRTGYLKTVVDWNRARSACSCE
jgi:DNA invertase Pin-like site-specific DNA recombinase